MTTLSSVTESQTHWQSYIPKCVQRRLVAAEPAVRPEGEVSDAVLLLSDIEGFSALVAQAAESGRLGLESLSTQLNTYFADLAGIIDDQGGDILFVAGDAFLCLFEPQGDGAAAMQDAAHRAAWAALAIQQRLRGLTLRTRIGIGCGALARGHVGGHGARWDLVLGGPALSEAIAAELAAPAGGVLLSDACARLLEGVAEFGAAPAGHALLAALDDAQRPQAAPQRDVRADPLALRPYVPAIVLQRALLTDSAWMAEFRTVSVVLSDLPPLAPGDQDSLPRLHAGVLAFQRAVARYEGTMKVDVDDKGVLVVGVFGLPSGSHEDNADRALRCALELSVALRGEGLPPAVGVATGRAFCGVFGSDRRREYMVRGECINLASRLATVGGDAVLCDRATVQAVRTAAASFEPAGEHHLRGQAQPLAVWRAVVADPATEAPAPALRTTSLVGRKAELAQLEAALDDAAAGRGGLVLIEAEAGLGKSRLVAELVRSAQDRGVRVLRGQAAPIERSTAYFAWRPVVRSLLRLDEEVLPGAAWPQRVAEALRDLPRQADAMPLLADVLALAAADNERTAEMRGEVRAENTRAAVRALLERAARERPTLLVLEDRHWFDSASSALLLALAQALGAAGLPLLLVATSRPHAAGDADPVGVELREHCRALAPARLIELQALSEAELRALMRHRLAVDELPEALVEFVSARVGGHPYFCEEFLQAMRESGALRVEEGRCTVGDLAALDLPTTVEGTIVARIDGLREAEQLCLKIGAVVGRQFMQRTVSAAHPLLAEQPQVPERLRVLCLSDLTQRELDSAEPAFRFKHQITRDVAYQMMSGAQRKPLHASVAQALEAAHAGDLAPPHAVLSFHWGQAGQFERALHHLERAGEQALRAGAFVEALDFFRQAVETAQNSSLALDAERVALWNKGRGTAHYFLGDMAASQACLERAVAVLDAAVPEGRAAVGASLRELLRHGLHALWPGRFNGRRAARKALLDEAVDIYRMLGQIYYLDGADMARVTYVTLRGVNVGESAGPSPGLARVLANTGSMMGWLGLNRWSDSFTARAVRMAGEGGQSGALAYVWSIAAITQAQRGRWSEALAANQRALELVQELGDHNVEAEVWIVRATVHDCAGDYAALATDWPRARALAMQRRNPQILCWSFLDECDACLGAGDTEGAARALEQALGTTTAAHDGSSTVDKAQARAVVRLRQGRLAEAAAAAREVIDLVTRQPPSGYHWVAFLANAVEVAIELAARPPSSGGTGITGSTGDDWRQGLAADAARGMRALEALSGRFRNVLPRSRLLRARLLSGAAAQAKLREALRLARQNGMPFEEARALAALAALGDLSGAGPALAIFEQLGAHFEAGRLRAVLAA
jgi:class 3 adenylate cyclase/tetratricopeptide (TPR) repeat protein